MKKQNNNKRNWKKFYIFSALIFITYFILLTAVTPKKYNLVKGDIASEDIKATRDIVDEEATEAKENEARELVPKQFSLKTDVKIEASQNITDFFNKLINLKSSQEDEVLKIKALKKIRSFNIIASIKHIPTIMDKKINSSPSTNTNHRIYWNKDMITINLSNS